jgi:hypothetical protein
MGDGLWATFDPDLDPSESPGRPVTVRPMFELLRTEPEYPCRAYRFKPSDLDDPEATVR